MGDTMGRYPPLHYLNLERYNNMLYLPNLFLNRQIIDYLPISKRYNMSKYSHDAQKEIIDSKEKVRKDIELFHSIRLSPAPRNHKGNIDMEDMFDNVINIVCELKESPFITNVEFIQDDEESLHLILNIFKKDFIVELCIENDEIMIIIDDSANTVKLSTMNIIMICWVKHLNLIHDTINN